MVSPATVTLKEILDSRDKRYERQKEWLGCCNGATLAVATVVMPGNIKRSDRSLKVGMAALEAMRRYFGTCITRIETFDLATGFEIFILAEMPVPEAKKKACQIEDSHPLGRLFDIDIISHDGTPVSRAEYGLPPRKCLICGNDARICMRTNAHPYEELLRVVEDMVDSFDHSPSHPQPDL